MVALVWDEVSKRTYETGVDHGVLYTPDGTGDYTTGVAWNGLVSVTETPAGAEANPQFADNIKYLNLISAETFAATIEAFTYPKEFNQHDGFGSDVDVPGLVLGQQDRKIFGLSYRTVHGNDVELNEYGYKLHLVYGCAATPSEKAYNTINDSPEAVTFSWDVTTTPVPVTGFKPTSLLVVDSVTADPDALVLLETQLYGSLVVTPNLPTPNEVITLLTPA
jgi:hypothetical protein